MLIYQFLTLKDLGCKIGLLSKSERKFIETCPYLEADEEYRQKRVLPIDICSKTSDRAINLHSVDHFAKICTEIHVRVNSNERRDYNVLEYLLLQH